MRGFRACAPLAGLALVVLISSIAAAPATAPATRATTQITLNFKDVPIDAVLEQLSDAAGYVVVKDVPVDGRVTVLSKQPVNADEAVVLLNTVLKSNGYTAIQMGRVLKVVARDKAKKANIPVHFGAEPNEIEQTDELITQVIPIRNVDAVKLKQDLSPLIGTDADITANGGSNAMILTDTSANIRRVVQIIATLDRTENSNFELRRYQLKNTSAASAAKLVTAIFKPTDPLALIQAMRSREGGGQPKGENQQEQALRGKINAASDDRTNTLYVTGPKQTLDLIDGIIKELEANPASATQLRIFPLKNSDASAAVRLLTTVFRSEDSGGGGRRDLPFPFPIPGMGTDQALQGRVTAAADDRTNSVVITAPAETMKLIEEIINRLDATAGSNTEIRIFPLQYADAGSLAKLLSGVFKPDDSSSASSDRRSRYGTFDQAMRAKMNIASDDRTNSLVVTGPPEAIRVIESVLKALDSNPVAFSDIKVFQLNFADSASAVKLIQTIFKPDDTAGKPGAPPVDRMFRGRLNVASDDRTNTIVVSAPPDMLKAIQGVIERLDANPTSEDTFFIYRLKNAQALNLQSVLNMLFGNNSGSGQYGAAGQRSRSSTGAGRSTSGLLGGGGTGIGSRRGTSSSGLGFGSSAYGSSSYGAYGSAYGSALGRTAGGGYPLSGLSSNSARAVNELTGEVYVVADPDTNSLLVTTATKYEQQVKQIIAELDKPVPQVLIKVLIAEVTHDNSDDLGAEFSVLNKRPNGMGQIIGTNFGVAQAQGGLIASVVEANVNAALHALQTEGKLDVLSRPYILASDNQLASITVGQEVPFITNTRVTDTGQIINTIEYQDVGIILNVTPHINPEGLVILDVTPEISQLTGTNVAISENATAPVIAKRSAESRVGIKNGQTIVIGGLMEDRKTNTVNKVPLLGDIPLIGALFQRNQTTKAKTELLIFLTPHVAAEADQLKPMSQDETNGTQLTPNAVEPGTFQEHMRGLERGATPTARTAPATVPATTSIPLTQPGIPRRRIEEPDQSTQPATEQSPPAPPPAPIPLPPGPEPQPEPIQ